MEGAKREPESGTDAEESDWETRWEQDQEQEQGEEWKESKAEREGEEDLPDAFASRVTIREGRGEEGGPSHVASTREKAESGLAKVQRGRGAFRYGSHSMYSDLAADGEERHAESPTPDEDWELRSRTGVESDPFQRDTGPGIASTAFSGHVVEAFDIPLSVKTVDLEESFPRHLKEGWRIKWIDDSHALLVFSSPEKARQALNEHSTLNFKIKLFSPDSEIAATGAKDYDWSPSVPRPKTSSRSAHRMVMSALNHSLGKSITPSLKKSEEEKEREVSRKNRIAVRQKLRQSAWGDDDD